MRTIIGFILISFLSIANADVFISGKTGSHPQFRPANPPNTIGVPAQNQRLRNRDAKDLYLVPPGQFVTTPRDQYRWRPTTKRDMYWAQNRDSKRRNGCCNDPSFRPNPKPGSEVR